MTIIDIAQAARASSKIIAASSGHQRTTALRFIAIELLFHKEAILEANALDYEAAQRKGLQAAFLDRLALSDERIDKMAHAVTEIADQEDIIGRFEEQKIRPNGLVVARSRIPLGVVAIIYEARPNVTSDVAALALRSGNAVILKGGSNAARSNKAIGIAIQKALVKAGLPENAVTVLDTKDRNEITELLQLEDLIDVVIPRGGEGLIRFVSQNSRIPVIKHYKGVCHIYIDQAADLEQSIQIVRNAKVSRPSVCNALETLLIHKNEAERFLPSLAAALFKDNVTIHGCPRTLEILKASNKVVPATEADWFAEYLSLDLAIRVVDTMDVAIAHIDKYGSDHTEAICTPSITSSNYFIKNVLSSCIMVNASTRFSDGGELGLGAEVGISTSRIHAYGPMGAKGLTTTRFVVIGEGHIR